MSGFVNVPMSWNPRNDKSIAWDGGKITRPGIYKNLSLEAYHNPDICDGPSISSSGLRDINPDRGSPAHFYAQWAGNPDAVPRDSAAFVLGRAAHHLMLGQDFFARLFVQEPSETHDAKGELKPWSYQLKSAKEWREKRIQEGRIPLSDSQVNAIKQMAVSLGNHPLVRQGALSGLVERSMFWRDKETGIWLKSRPDAIPTDSGDFVDLKTTPSIMWNDLSRTLREFSYYQQAALIRTASREVLGIEMASFTLIFVEKKPPWCTRDVRIDDQDLHRGERMNRACLRTFARCIKERRWPGPGDGNEGNERLSLSPAAREAIDNRLKMEGLADGED